MSQDINTTQNNEEKNNILISANTGLEGKRLRNFYFVQFLQGFSWMLFHFTIIYFFGLLLGNIAMVGLVLGFANFIAFLSDIPLGIIQRYFSTKTIYIWAVMLEIIATCILFSIIGKFFFIMQDIGVAISPLEGMKDAATWFFGSAINWIGILVISVCYGLIFELEDVASFGYIISNASPEQSGIIISRREVFCGAGNFTGLLLSGVLLSFNNIIALICLGIILVGVLYLMIHYFDNSVESLQLSDIKNFSVSLKQININESSKYLTEKIQKTDIKKIITSTSNYLFLKPKAKKEASKKIPWKEVFAKTKTEMKLVFRVITANPLNYGVLWSISLVLIFGFWDTFAASFLLEFLDDVKPGWGYVLLACIAVPGILFQEHAVKFSQKIGARFMGSIGLVLSIVSLIFMGFLALSDSINPMTILIIALVNSFGYAIGMAIGQTNFLQLYNVVYAKETNLKEIDANASSGPMKILQNIANVIGFGAGGFLLMFGFSFFFFIFSAIMLGILIWTLKNRKNIKI